MTQWRKVQVLVTVPVTDDIRDKDVVFAVSRACANLHRQMYIGFKPSTMGNARVTSLTKVVASGKELTT